MFHYVPQVSAFRDGTVVMGTTWNQGVPEDNFQQTLLTSNGGLMTQAYVCADTRIDLGRALPQHSFFMAGKLDKDTNPFCFLATCPGSAVVPGYFFVSYEYEFWNPVGESWAYAQSGPVRLDQVAQA